MEKHGARSSRPIWNTASTAAQTKHVLLWVTDGTQCVLILSPHSDKQSIHACLHVCLRHLQNLKQLQHWYQQWIKWQRIVSSFQNSYQGTKAELSLALYNRTILYLTTLGLRVRATKFQRPLPNNHPECSLLRQSLIISVKPTAIRRVIVGRKGLQILDFIAPSTTERRWSLQF